MTLNSILEAQRRWAERRGNKISGNYTERLEDNLFRPLNPKTRDEFAQAAGNELCSSDKRGKMCSLRSSSALAVNFFDSWRGTSLDRLADALGAKGNFTELQFEQKYPHGIRGIPPNIDVVLQAKGGNVPLAIESKFAEPYDGQKPHPPLDPKYFPENRRLWHDVGLAQCQSVAEAIGHELSFVKLHAAQLLKHVLGLRRAHPVDRPRLVYLWYDPKSGEGETHRSEIHQFASVLNNDIDFTSLTYQTVFERLKPFGEANYVAYLDDRYFAP